MSDDKSEVVKFNPPQQFLVLKTFISLEIGADGNIDSVLTDSVQHAYVLTPELKKVLFSLKPDFSFS